MTIEHLLSALIARGLPSRPPTFSIPYTGAQLSSRYSCFFDPPTYSLQCLVLPDSGFPAFWFHQTFRLDWLRVGIPTSSLPKAEGLPKTPHVITLVFWPLHLDFSLPRSLKSTQPPPKYILYLGHLYPSISTLPLIPHEIAILAYCSEPGLAPESVLHH